MQISKLNILYIEPFYVGSHKKWIDTYKKYSSHNISILSLPGKKWKWRMHGGAITLAKMYNDLNKNFDLIICSDMLNLPVFKSLSNNIQSIKTIMYFHENQLSYPWSPLDKDLVLKRDLHYHYINYTSSLVSDYNYFNSQYHLDSYIKGLKKYLKKMPDLRNQDTIDTIYKKSCSLPIGCNLKYFKKLKIKTPIILWNHRWEYDKNPELFFKILFRLKNKKINFKLIVLGEKYQEYPEIFDIAQKKLKNEIIHFGYCESQIEYIKWIKMSNILPVTSNQDFFGISIVEAVGYGNYPILPKRLSYPEIFEYKNNMDLFYLQDDELLDRVIKAINNINNLNQRINKLSSYIYEKYNWKNISKKYDKMFESIIN